MSLLNEELARERIRSLNRELSDLEAALLVRRARRTRRDARIRALRLSRILLVR